MEYIIINFVLLVILFVAIFSYVSVNDHNISNNKITINTNQDKKQNTIKNTTKENSIIISKYSLFTNKTTNKILVIFYIVFILALIQIKRYKILIKSIM